MASNRITRTPGLFDEVRMMRKMNQIIVPVSAGLTSALTGTGAVASSSCYAYVNAGATAGSTALYHCLIFGLGNGLYASSKMDFTKKIAVSFSLYTSLDDAAIIRYWHMKATAEHADLGATGVGLKLANLTLYGESFGTERGEVELMTLAATTEYLINIELDPAGGTIKWYVNGVLKGTQSTAAKRPSTVSSDTMRVVMSIGNGAANVAGRIYTSPITIISEV